MNVTRPEFDEAELGVRLRLSTHPPDAQTWQEWAALLDGRVKCFEMWSKSEQRPSYASALYLAADAFGLLAAIIRAEHADPSSGEAA
jgi:hypothetical protein